MPEPTATAEQFFTWLRDVVGIVELLPPDKPCHVKEVRFTRPIGSGAGAAICIEVESYDVDQEGKRYAIAGRDAFGNTDQRAATRVTTYPVPAWSLANAPNATPQQPGE